MILDFSVGDDDQNNGLIKQVLVIGFVVLLVCYAAVKLALRPYSSNEHSFTRTNQTKSRQERKLYSPPAGYFLNKDHLYLFTQTWLPLKSTTNPKAVIVLVHGVGEHCGRYEALARQLCDKLGVAVVALDHQGHGKSEGDRLFVRDFDDFVDDVEALTKQTQAKFPGVPCVILGHSMGGLIAIRTVQKYPKLFVSAIFSAPALGVSASKTMLKYAPLLAERVPHLPTQRLDPNLLCRDPCVVDLYCNDPLCSKQGVTARLGYEILGAIEKALAWAREVEVPYLIVRGSEDKITLKPEIEQFQQATSSNDNTFVELKGLYHEIFNEKGEQALNLVVDWITKRLAMMPSTSSMV